MPAEMSPQGFAHDFGKLQKGVQAEYAFVVVNTSTVPLNMSLRYSGCSFPKTARLSDSVLQPGQQATVEIVVDTRRFVGPRSAALYLSAENDRLMVTVFTITADCVDTQGNPF
jgi:hypothetical protein